jgi:PAS domain S-box-containing protein
MKDQAGETANAPTTIELLRLELQACQRELEGCRQLIEQMESQRLAEDDRNERWWLSSSARESRFSILDGLPTLVTLMTPEGELEYANSNVLEYFGSTLEELRGWEPGSTFHPDDRLDAIAHWRKSVETGGPFDFEGRHRAADGFYHWFHMRGFPLPDAEGRIVLWYLLHTDIDRRKRAESLLAGERRLLEMMATGQSLSAILAELCLLAEQLCPGCACCSILLLNSETKELWRAASPSVPDAYTVSMNGLAIGPDIGSCGSAAYHSKQIIASEIATDPRWAESRELALANGLKACWSTPILSRQNRVLGTFAMFSGKPGNPTTDDQEVIAQTTRLAGIAVERAQNDAALKSSEARKTAILDSALDCIVTIDHEARITEFNLASERTFGHRREDVLGELLADVIIPPSLREQHKRGFARYLATGEARMLGRRMEATAVRADGSEFPVELAITRISLEGPPSFTGCLRDITVAKETEAYLRASAKIAQSLLAVRTEVSAALSKPIQVREMLQECAQAMVRHLEAAFARIWTLNHKGDLLELQASAGCYTRLDGTHSRIEVGSLKVGLIALERKPYLTNDVLNDPRIGDKEWARSCGFVSFVGYPLVVDCRTVGVIGMFARHALTDAVIEGLASVADAIAQGIQRKRKEDELRRSEAYLAEAQKLSLTGSFGWSVSADEHFWSDETFRIFEYDPSAKVTLQMVLKRVHPDDLSLVKQIIERASHDGQDWELGYRLLMPNGAVKHVHVVAHATSSTSGNHEFVGAVMDVTATRRAEEAQRRGQADLARVSRMTTLGELTASIAHEVNQPLGSIVNNANACLSLLTHGAPQIGEIRQALLEIIQGTDQASAVISRVRQLVRKAPSERTILNLIDVVQEVLVLARHELAARQVTVLTGLAEDLPLVQGDRVQLQQVLLNLIVNGMDAMNATEQSKRALTICGRHEMRDGQSMCLVSVQDAGIGFKSEEMDRLFDAFYTTKPQGMGMGLAISRSIIEAHGGRLWAEPNPGQGANFIFSLPEALSATPSAA